MHDEPTLEHERVLEPDCPDEEEIRQMIAFYESLDEHALDEALATKEEWNP